MGGWLSAGKAPTHGHIVVGRGVGGIDDPERRLAGRDQRQRGAHIVRLRNLGRDGLPHAQRPERRLAVNPGGHRIHKRHGEPAFAQQAGEVQARPDPDGRRTPAVGDQHEGVAQQVEAARRIDKAVPLQRIHPARIGRDEDVRRRTVLDLAGEGGGTGERDGGGMAGRPLERGGNLVHRILQAGRGEDRNPVRAEAGRNGAQAERQAGSEPEQAAAGGQKRQRRRSPAIRPICPFPAARQGPAGEGAGPAQLEAAPRLIRHPGRSGIGARSPCRTLSSRPPSRDPEQPPTPERSRKTGPRLSASLRPG